MTGAPVPSLADVEAFRAAVARRLGLSFDEGRTEVLARVLAERLVRHRAATLGAYLEALDAGDEARELASLLTVNETYFYRGAEQFTALASLLRQHARPGHRLRVLSAGCASGEEPYTMAMVAREVLGGAAGDRVQILAIDVSPACLARARTRRYSAWSLRDTNDARRARWFRGSGGDFFVVPEVADMVHFEERNLVDEADAGAIPGALDIVFCRNVVMYFSADTTRRLVHRLASALLPGGHLFLGHAETLRGVSDAFHIRHHHGAFYYQRRDPGTPHAPATEVGAVPELPLPPIVAEPTRDATDWQEAIGGASRKIQALEGGLRTPAYPPVVPTVAPPETAAALALLREDRFAEALAALPPTSATDADTDLLRAVLLVGAGDIAGAALLAEARLERDELQAPWHYVRALCCESGGDSVRAAHHHRVAAYLDPGFAMPHLRLGMLARRDGDDAVARRELGQAAALLELDDPVRILLFGGGFSRDSLVTLCRRELAACPTP